MASPSWAQAPGAGPTLPLKRVRLYETGVGYFERSGQIQGSGNVALPVPAGHLDDALKTLVVLSQGGQATVSGIEFASSVSNDMARALAGLPNGGTEVDQQLGYQSLLRSLKGAEVQLQTTTGSYTGRLIDVLEPDAEQELSCEPVAAGNGNGNGTGNATDGRCVKRPYSTLLLLTKAAEIRRFRSLDVQSVKPTDAAVQGRLGSALDALSQKGAQARRQLRVTATGSQPVTLGYVAEAPVWRSTYRLVLQPAADRGSLQGWALLHNDTDEDWQQVRLELVNGQPDSFLFPLAAPRYTRRELVTPERDLSTVPQLLDQTVDNMWSGESYGAGGLGLSGIGEGGGGRGEGIGLGSIGTIGHGAGAGSGGGASSLLAVGDLAGVPQSEGVEAGALFRYSLPAPVDLRAHGSALLPFVQQSVEVQRIAYFASPGAVARSAVHLRNSTQQTLPPGTVAVFADGGFAGESALSRTKPKESRIIRFGHDLDVELTEEEHDYEDLPQVFYYDRQTLTEHFVRRHDIRYQLENRSGSPRKAYLALSFVRNASVTGTDGLVFDDEQNQAFAALDIGPRQKQLRRVQVREGRQRSHDLTELSAKQLRDFAQATTVAPAQRKVLEQAADKRTRAEKLRQNAAGIRSQLEQLDRDISRHRQNLRALGNRQGKSAETFVQRLLAAENRVNELRKRQKRISAQIENALASQRTILVQLNKTAQSATPTTPK